MPPPAGIKIDTKGETNHESEKLDTNGSRREKLTDSAYLGAVVLSDHTGARTEENKRDVDVEQGDGEVASDRAGFAPIGRAVRASRRRLP